MECSGLRGRNGWDEKGGLVGMPTHRNQAPVLRGTHMPVDAIVNNYDYGVSIAEIAEQFRIAPDSIEVILAYAKSHRVAHRA